MRFVELLNSYIERSDITKNSLIESVGIDRSTFFQILSGKRLPTNRQLLDIINKLDIANVEKDRLIDYYERESLGEDVYQAHMFVRSAVKIIAEAYFKKMKSGISILSTDELEFEETVISGKTAIREVVRQLIIKEMTVSKHRIDIFMPLMLASDMEVFQTLKFLSGDESVSNTPIRQLIEFPVGNIFKNSENTGILNSYLGFLLGQSLNYKAFYYYANSDTSTRMGVLFPYYMIFSDRIILLDRDGDKLIVIDDSKAYDIWVSEFEKLLDSSDSLVSSFSDKEDYVRLLGSRGDKTLYIVEKHPGISFMMTEEFMNKYIPKNMHEEIYAHVNCFIGADYVEIVSDEGIKEFGEQKSINEAGFKLDADEQDVAFVMEMLKKRLHDTLEIADPEELPISDNWTISVVEDEYVVLVPYLTLDKIIYISEKNIVKAFTQYMKGIITNHDA